MKWIKKGLIYGPDGKYSWAKNSALTPTPILLNDKIIRIYAGFRDENGVSRIGFVDVDAENPSIVINVSKTPVLDVGIPGTFDDNGMILGDVIKYKEKIYMYYVGFQLVEKIKFLAFTGLAISTDNGDTFCKYSRTPILDRSNEGIYIRAIHFVLIEKGIWKIWYSLGNEWQWINGKPFPRYNIWYIESKDGKTFLEEGKLCIDVKESEYRIGRARIYRVENKYIMFYTRGTIKGDYIIGYAKSINGIDWIRVDDKIGISLSKTGWDSKALSYPALIRYKEKIYMFYNGNDMGKSGFGYAILKEW
ncbi:hypothetical protein ES704_00059 [subsurface metagenome]|jgi:hypothetical protein